MMAGHGAARRRRDRQRRSVLRHDQTNVQTILSEALHHSAQSVKVATHRALRRMKADRTREGEVNEEYFAPRRQTTPSLGTRPSCRRGGFVWRPGHSCFVGAPCLAPPSLELVVEHGDTTVAYLLKSSMLVSMREEDERWREAALLRVVEQRITASAAAYILNLSEQEQVIVQQILAVPVCHIWFQRVRPTNKLWILGFYVVRSESFMFPFLRKVVVHPLQLWR